MKKQAKKLVLAKETISRLENSDLAMAAGGEVTSDCYSGDIGCELQKIWRRIYGE